MIVFIPVFMINIFTQLNKKDNVYFLHRSAKTPVRGGDLPILQGVSLLVASWGKLPFGGTSSLAGSATQAC